MSFLSFLTLSAQTVFYVNNQTALENAISTSNNPADIIYLENNIVVNSEITISKSLIINGQGFTISVPEPGLTEAGIINANASDFRVFLLNGSNTIAIKNITIKGGTLDSNNYWTGGSGIKIEEANTTAILENVTIRQCRTIDFIGGGAVVNNGTVYFISSKLIRNSADYGGGFLNNGNMYIEESVFADNRSEASNGGGGAGENGWGAVLYVNNSTFSNNKSTEIGGAINNYQGNIWVINSTFAGNVAYGPEIQTGGAIGINGGSVTVLNSVFAYNYKRTGGTADNPTAYALEDIAKYSSGTFNAYYNIFHGVNPSHINVNIGNISYNGNPNGSDNSIFTNGDYTLLTNGQGTPIGTARIFQPFLVSTEGNILNSLQDDSFIFQHTGVTTGFSSQNNVIGYYDDNAWVTLLGSNPQNYIVETDQLGLLEMFLPSGVLLKL